VNRRLKKDPGLDLLTGVAAATQATKCKRLAGTASGDPFTETELDWFARNSYNVALKYYGEWSPELVVLLLSSCLTVRRGPLWKRPTRTLILGSS